MNLETYLKQATRGIWGKRKQDAILELRGNIEARIWTLEHQGKLHSKALEIALRELGDARVVNSAMVRVHTWPGMMRGLLLAGLCSSAIIASLNSSQAQVSIIHANNDEKTQITKTAWISMSSLKANLEAAGIAVNDQPQTPIAQFGYKLEKNQPNPTPTLEFKFPGASKATKIQALVGLTITSDNRFQSDGKYSIRDFSSDAKPGEVYLNFASLRSHFLDTRLPVSVRGWRNPTWKIGQTRLQLGDETRPAFAYNTYLGLATQLLKLCLGYEPNNYTSPRWWSPSGEYRHNVRVSDLPGSVYALVTVTPPFFDPGVTFDVAVVNENLTLEFLSAWKNLQFDTRKNVLEQDIKQVKTLSMQSYLMGTQTTGFGSAKRPANVVLMKLTGSFDPRDMGEIVMPVKPRSAAIK